MIKIVLIICILLLTILYFKKSQENLFYDENTFQTLQTQEKILNELQNQYDNNIPDEDRITNLSDKRANLLYKLKI